MNQNAPRGLHGQTVRQIAKRILSGHYVPGETIDVVSLEAEFDISRTAMREALKVLVAKGLVDAKQKRGTFVRPREEWHLLDADVMRWQFDGNTSQSLLDNLDEMRYIVEPAAAGLAATRHDIVDLHALRAALQGMEQAAGDPGQAAEADLAFHLALLAATHNELLIRMKVLWQTGLAARDRLVHGADPHDDPVPSHQAVFDAISHRDAAAAENATRQVLDKSMRDLQRARRTRQ